MDTDPDMLLLLICNLLLLSVQDLKLDAALIYSTYYGKLGYIVLGDRLYALKCKTKYIYSIPVESYQGNNQICILVNLFKGHTSILWIQISMEKAYQSHFAHPASHPTKLE